MANETDLLKQLIREHVKRTLIYEGLIFSYSSSVVYRKLKEMGYNISYNNKFFSINFVLSDENEKNYKKLNDFMNKPCGWEHGASIAGGRVMDDKLKFLDEPNGNVIFQYEPKFDVEVNNLPPILYHLTSVDKLDKILKNGLVPKSSDNFFSFTDRVYLSTNIESLYEFAKNKFFTTKVDDKNIKYKIPNKFVILQIKPENRIRFFRDPNFSQGVYTLENIDRWSIKQIEEIELNGNGEIIKKTKI